MIDDRVGRDPWRKRAPSGAFACIFCLVASACSGSSGGGGSGADGSSADDSAGGSASTQTVSDGSSASSASQGGATSQATSTTSTTSTNASGGSGTRTSDGGAGGTGASATSGGASGGNGNDTTSSGGVGQDTSGGGAGGDGGGTAGVGGSSDSSGGVAGQSSSGGTGGAGGSSGNVCDPGPNGCGDPVSMIPVAGCGICGNVVLDFELGEATDERLSFTFRLRAHLFGAVPLNDIEVQYYFSQEEDSPWQASIDSFLQHGPDVDLTSSATVSIEELHPTLDTGQSLQTHYIRIRNDSTAELAEADDTGEPYLEVQVTLEPSDTGAPNQVHDDDWSYQSNTTEFMDNLGMGVFVCQHLASGCTPGQSGVGE